MGFRHNLAILLLLFVYGCGGSSGNDASKRNQPSSDDIKITIPDTTFAKNKSIELILHFPDNEVSNISWQQSPESNTKITSPTSKVISVTPPISGSIEFTANFELDGTPYTVSEIVEVSDIDTFLTSTSGHAVVAGNKVSLRVFSINDPNPANDPVSVQWLQTAGPSIAIEETDSSLLIFDAPQVTKDTIISFEVTAVVGEQERKDTVSILVESAEDIANNAYFDDRVAKTKPFKSDSPYAESLTECVYSNTLTSSCTLETLPLLAQTTLSPTIEQVMDRVVVSHPWMGERFEQFLHEKDEHGDFLKLLRATTAIVISYDIRPSFYWAATGAIYLDPEYLWLTATERDTINEEPDYRSDFGNSLQFSIPWRYVKANDYAFDNFKVEQRESRNMDSITYRLSYLLYHELAHANDYLPSTRWSSLDLEERILDEVLEQNIMSDTLSVLYPLNSQQMKDLAQVRYSGTTATSSQKALQPQDITPLFEPDGGVHFYSYRSEREDFAMLFEELMMQVRFGVYRDVAITNNPDNDLDESGDYIVAWGQRGRLAENQIAPRMKYATNAVMPDFDVDNAINQLPSTQSFNVGQTWQENLVLDGGINGLKRNTIASRMLSSTKQLDDKDRKGYVYYHKPLPKK